ncbi:MAG: hypothetical protein JSW56_17500 [Deltaproteobacteria bacterium]|nr:MAG: hypothetical protein JSW56_17500 [Deltaproteobacteria bacterium]
MKTRNLLIVCVTLLLAGVLFWPTLYRYDKIDFQGLSTLVRINRLTGYTEYYMLGQWVPEGLVEKQRESQPLPSAEKSLLIAKASLGPGLFNGEIYNGSNWTITSVTFRVVAKEKSGGVRWDRKFRETVRLNSLAASNFAVTVSEAEGVGSFDWSIDEVLGYKAQ